MSETTAATTLDRSERSGHAGLLLLLAGLLVAAVLSLSLLSDEKAQVFIVAFLAILAVAGIFCLFGLAVGVLQFAGRVARNDLTKLMADTAAEGLIVVESDGRVIYANGAFLTLSGCRTAAEVRTVERLFTGAPEVSEAIYRLSQAVREGRAAGEEIRLAPALNGAEAAWYRVRVRPLARPGGRNAALWTIADVTRDRERQENVFQELQHAIDYLDHAPAGFLSIDPAGEIVYMNATLAGWLDHDLAQVGSGGLSVADVVPPNAAALIGAVTGGPGEVRTEIIDIDLRRRGGQSLPVRLFHRVAFGADGRPGASRTLVLNRSPGEDVAEGQRAAEVRFARFFNDTPVAIAAVGRRGEILRSNAAFARLFGAPGERTITGVVAERDEDALGNALAAAGEGRGDIVPLDVAIRGAEDRSARIYVSGVADAEGDGEAAIVYALETTEQRALEAQFAQAQKMQAVGQLAGGVAHDFNNVLQAIIGYSDLLLANHRPTDPSFQDIMQIKQNANRAASLVRQLLAFSRRQTLRPQVIQLSDSLSDLSLLLKRLIGERIELELRHGRDMWLTKADVNQFEQVIVNLAVNARDAMPDGGKLSIRTQNVPAHEVAAYGYKAVPEADFVLVEVSDTGTGIPPHVLDKIFEPFFTTKDVGKGTGLGLSTVYGIVKQTGGFIFCDSSVGEGTTFRIFLPRHVPLEQEAAPKPGAAKTLAADLTGRGTILLVEDEEAVRAFGARALTSRGYTVLEASSGTEAMAIVDGLDQPVDLVVSDVVMPEMDGPTLLRALRERFPSLKIIFVSGYAEDAFKKNLPEGEQFTFLPKPFSLKQLVEAVKTQLK
ncbi:MULTISPECIES: cell cycle histidine kinase CckA [unclassified Chelatococcus]|uniref:cell cycle histidine kinase CckA n=1 Tax=unclassified Chelatococcus TaxID=2638111 RepID=UPI0002E4FEE7|nr:MULTISPECIES: response regulator [unclassified Chelatococcus]ALA16269.1 histidine kinase [Chelatococcus sp. CO-6]